jgi:hypothetical protein
MILSTPLFPFGPDPADREVANTQRHPDRCASILLRHPGRRYKYGAGISRASAHGESYDPIGQSAERGTGRHIDTAVHQHAAAEGEQGRDHFKSGAADTMRSERSGQGDHNYER